MTSGSPSGEEEEDGRSWVEELRETSGVADRDNSEEDGLDVREVRVPVEVEPGEVDVSTPSDSSFSLELEVATSSLDELVGLSGLSGLSVVVACSGDVARVEEEVVPELDKVTNSPSDELD